MTAIDDPAAPVARNPRREAQEVVGDAFDARVLEPSPPAVVDGDLFADDPVARAGPAGRPVLAPVSSADLTWDQWLGERPERAPWAAARWLAAWRRLPPLPPAYAETRLALHRLVVYVASPARQRVNGKMALRWTFGGLGTPFFGDDEQARVAGAGLVRQRGPAAEAAEITTLNEAAELVLDGPPDLAWVERFDVPAAGDLDDRLAGLTDLDNVVAVSADLVGSARPAAPTWRDDYRTWRAQRLAQITRTYDGLDEAAHVLGRFLDQVRRVGIRNFVAAAEEDHGHG